MDGHLENMHRQNIHLELISTPKELFKTKTMIIICFHLSTNTITLIRVTVNVIYTILIFIVDRFQIHYNKNNIFNRKIDSTENWFD